MEEKMVMCEEMWWVENNNSAVSAALLFEWCEAAE
jgi:hypothetical protein